MILNTKEFKEACQTILYAIDNKDVTIFTETLELVTAGNQLNLNVTNREYLCSTSFNLDSEEKFRAAVNAKTFLSLISKITTENVELKVDKTKLKVKANGEYELPLIYNNDVILELPTIPLGTVTNEMKINSSTLISILNHNSKELLRGIPAKPVQKYYYVDEQGAITFTSGACVNSFTLEKPIKILLSDKVVKLFKLFKEDSEVNFKLGQNVLDNDLTQTILQFSNDRVVLTAKMPDVGMITGVPVSAIRSMATKDYPHSIVMDKDLLTQAINRIMLFNDSSYTYGNIEIKGNKFTLQNFNGGSVESLDTINESSSVADYKLILDLKNLKLILDGCAEQYVTMCFGDSKAVVVKKQDISDIIPEIKVS